MVKVGAIQKDAVQTAAEGIVLEDIPIRENIDARAPCGFDIKSGDARPTGIKENGAIGRSTIDLGMADADQRQRLGYIQALLVGAA